jgi:tetratricopeptide (TPR) repeat protein
MLPASRAAAVALAALALAGCRTTRDVQRDYAQTLRPAWVAARELDAARLRTYAVRVQVRADYRAENTGWRERVAAQVERANALLGAQLGVRLAVKEVRDWDRVGDRRDLQAALADLVAADPGEDVDWVIGLVGAVPIADDDHEAIGMAEPFGRHVVLRGMASWQEAESIHRALDHLPEDEREDLIADRRRHRETAVLLHEWAHTLGAVHERDPGSLMHPRYHHRASVFSPFSARLVALGLEARRVRGAAAARGWARAYGDALEGGRAQAWDPQTIQVALSEADRIGRAPAPPGVRPASAGAPAERRDPSWVDPAIEAEAARALALAKRGACTDAEAVAERAREARDSGNALATCRWTRQWLGLPRGVKGVPPPREPEYVAAVRAARADVEAGRIPEARRAASALERTFPGSPAPALLRCLAEARLGDTGRMRAACGTAARVAPTAYEPAYVLGRVAGHHGRWGEARDHLVRALANDDGDREAWARLGAAYRTLGDAAALAELDRRHRHRFGAPLSPAW